MTQRKDIKDLKKRGRKSSYKEEYADQAHKLALLGLTDEEMAEFFGIGITTINRWKKDYPEFQKSLKAGKVVADANVVTKLYRRATGYDYDETSTTRKGRRTICEKHTSKHQPADTTAAIFWLKNRQPDKWRDRKEVEANVNLGDELEEMTDEQLAAIVRGEKE